MVAKDIYVEQLEQVELHEREIFVALHRWLSSQQWFSALLLKQHSLGSHPVKSWTFSSEKSAYHCAHCWEPLKLHSYVAAEISRSANILYLPSDPIVGSERMIKVVSHHTDVVLHFRSAPFDLTLRLSRGHNSKNSDRWTRGDKLWGNDNLTDSGGLFAPRCKNGTTRINLFDGTFCSCNLKRRRKVTPSSL